MGVGELCWGLVLISGQARRSGVVGEIGFGFEFWAWRGATLPAHREMGLVLNSCPWLPLRLDAGVPSAASAAPKLGLVLISAGGGGTASRGKLGLVLNFGLFVAGTCRRTPDWFAVDFVSLVSLLA